MRRIDSLQISKIINAKGDDEEVFGYRREAPGDGTAKKTLYYKDWAADEDNEDFDKASDENGTITWEENVVVYHCRFERLGKRGNGLLFTVCNWARENRRFMEARVSITQALARFALKMTAKGDAKQLAALPAQIQSTIPATGIAIDRNPPKSAGATMLANQGVDISAMPRTTGGGEARADGDQLKLMISAGTNIMLHYFGDPSTGNLATADSRAGGGQHASNAGCKFDGTIDDHRKRRVHGDRFRNGFVFCMR